MCGPRLLQRLLSLNNKEKDILKFRKHFTPKNRLLTQTVKLILFMKKRTKWSETSLPLNPTLFTMYLVGIFLNYSHRSTSVTNMRYRLRWLLGHVNHRTLQESIICLHLHLLQVLHQVVHPSSPHTSLHAPYCVKKKKIKKLN